MCIEAVVWNLLHLGESWRCRKDLERLLYVAVVALCRDNVATEVPVRVAMELG